MRQLPPATCAPPLTRPLLPTAAPSSEEEQLESYIKGIADSGARVVVSGGAIGEMAMHFLEKHGLLVLRVPSKFDLRRVCRATGAVARVKLYLLYQSPRPTH